MYRLTRYREFLSLPGTSRLLVSSLAARLPLGMSSLAILLLVRVQTGSFAIAGIAVGAFTLSSAATSPVQGMLVDRLGGDRVLVAFAVGQAGALVAVVLAAQARAASGVVVVLAALAGALAPPVSASVRALWPRVAPTARAIETAYQLDAITQEVIFTAGPLLVAVVVATASPAAAVLLATAIAVAGTVWFATAPASKRWHDARRPESRRTAITVRGLWIVLGVTALMGFGIGAVEVGLPGLAVAAGSHAAAGLLLALWSMGSMVGGLAYGSRTWRAPTTARYPVLLLLVVVTTAPLILAQSLAAGVPLSLLAGVGYAPMLACQYAIVGALAPSEVATEAFTWTTAGLIAGIAGGNAVAGSLVQAGGIGKAFAVACLATGFAAAVAAGSRRRLLAAVQARTSDNAALPVAS